MPPQCIPDAGKCSECAKRGIACVREPKMRKTTGRKSSRESAPMAGPSRCNTRKATFQIVDQQMFDDGNMLLSTSSADIIAPVDQTNSLGLVFTEEPLPLAERCVALRLWTPLSRKYILTFTQPLQSSAVRAARAADSSNASRVRGGARNTD